MATTLIFLHGEPQGQRSLWTAAIYGVTQSRTQLKRLSSISSTYNLYVYTIYVLNTYNYYAFIMHISSVQLCPTV